MPLSRRLTTVLIVAAAMVGESWQAAWNTALQDHTATASPNAGWPMAAMAGALRVRLEKIDHYVLGGEYRSPGASDIAAARRLVSCLADTVICSVGFMGMAGTLPARRGDAT